MADEEEHSLVCMEVWGGNQAVNSSVRLAGLDAWVYSKPYEQADGGGDVYYVSSCATGRITRLLVADVSGHGNAVSELAVSLRQLMRQHVNHIDQVKFVRRMNEQFVLQSTFGSFATAVVTTYFAPTCSLSLCNAGHPPPLLYRAKEKSWRYIEHADYVGEDLADVPLGIVDLADYQQFNVQLERDDLVMCYTDSLPEARCRDGSCLDMAGLLKIVESVDIADPATLIPRVVHAIESHCGNLITGDDITVLLFRPNPATARMTWRTRLAAPFRIIGITGRALIRGEKGVPTPEWSLANIGGWMLPALGRLYRRPR
ncbi:MAG: serine/threonine-protein phosphatase [Burkholderiales bacterium]|nr:serine/threonine-protein phosphatase [Phycisphaerae bacterium]